MDSDPARPKYELKSKNRGLTDKELLNDLFACAMRLNKRTITAAEYLGMGKVHPSTVQRRFGTWVEALDKAGLSQSRSKIGISDDELFENLQNVWDIKGGQPTYSDMSTHLSKFHPMTYFKRFGSWSKALEEFVQWANSGQPGSVSSPLAKVKHSTIRNPSSKLRSMVIARDGGRCVNCGATPADDPKVKLEVDHIVPWSKGGETVAENLRTTCRSCNRGKGKEVF